MNGNQITGKYAISWYERVETKWDGQTSIGSLDQRPLRNKIKKMFKTNEKKTGYSCTQAAVFTQYMVVFVYKGEWTFFCTVIFSQTFSLKSHFILFYTKHIKNVIDMLLKVAFTH